jgi:GNAT superfamily N-acetyltransferase
MTGTMSTETTAAIVTMTDTIEPDSLNIRAAVRDDCGLILQFITELADYEKLAGEVSASAEALAETLFGSKPAAEVLIAEWRGQPAGFALYFTNYSTFLARPGIYLEDLFVRPAFRGRGIGKALLAQLAKLLIERAGGRLDWWVLNWNETAIDFYRRIGAKAMDEWLPMRLQGQALRDLADHPP